MSKPRPRSQRHGRSDAEPHREKGHALIVVEEYLPGNKPSDYDIDLSAGDGYTTRFWRCRNCGQERNRRSEFREPCTVTDLPTPLSDGGYDVTEPRTRRALTENMVVRFGECGPIYEVASESGNTYEVNIDEASCTCPDHQQRDVECKHLRRVDLDIRAGNVPGPDGTFRR